MTQRSLPWPMHLELLGLREQGVCEWTERSDGLRLGASHGCYFWAGKCDRSKGIIKIQLGVRATVMRRPVQWAVGAFLMRKNFSPPFNSAWGSTLDVGKNLGVVGAHKICLGTAQLQCQEGRKKHKRVMGETSNVVGLARLTKKKIEKTKWPISGKKGD